MSHAMQMTDTLAFRPDDVSGAPAHHYQTIEAVLSDASLDVQQKRAILSSWASDLWAIESCPWLRQVPGVKSPLRVSDIFAALRSLDDDPPRGGGSIVRIDSRRAMRTPQPSGIET